MKKFLSLFVIAALLLPVLAGCNSASQSENTPAPRQSPAPGSGMLGDAPVKTAAVSYITVEEAVAIALKDANLTRDQVRDLDADLDKDDGKFHYDVDFEKDNKEYEYEIDAVTGAILRKDVPKPTSSSSSSSSSEKQLTKTEARDIALKHAGLSVSDVRELEVELDRDDGKLHYDVDFESGGYDYDYKIDAVSGKILKSQKERD